MKSTWIVLAFVIPFWVGCGKGPSQTSEKKEQVPVPKVIVEKERVEKEPPLPGEVKIKLKRDGKDNYSWELSSSDVDQMMKVNDKLRKRVGGEKGP